MTKLKIDSAEGIVTSRGRRLKFPEIMDLKPGMCARFTPNSKKLWYRVKGYAFYLQSKHGWDMSVVRKDDEVLLVRNK